MLMICEYEQLQRSQRFPIVLPGDETIYTYY